MHALWSQRNQRRRGENVPPIRVAVNWAVDLAHDLWQTTQEKKPIKPVNVRQSWWPPPNGWSKCNVDAAFDAIAGQGATTAILRTDDGSFGSGCAC